MVSDGKEQLEICWINLSIAIFLRLMISTHNRTELVSLNGDYYSTGQSISIATNFATTFVLSQTFLTMLCHFKLGAFLFYAGWIAIMTIFVVLFVPETKGVTRDSTYLVWEKRWYWNRFVKTSA